MNNKAIEDRRLGPTCAIQRCGKAMKGHHSLLSQPNSRQQQHYLAQFSLRTMIVYTAWSPANEIKQAIIYIC